MLGQRTGWSALHFASRYGQIEIVRILVEHGADPDLPDRVLDITISHGADFLADECLAHRMGTLHYIFVLAGGTCAVVLWCLKKVLLPMLKTMRSKHH